MVPVSAASRSVSDAIRGAGKSPNGQGSFRRIQTGGAQIVRLEPGEEELPHQLPKPQQGPTTALPASAPITCARTQCSDTRATDDFRMLKPKSTEGPSNTLVTLRTSHAKYMW